MSGVLLRQMRRLMARKSAKNAGVAKNDQLDELFHQLINQEDNQNQTNTESILRGSQLQGWVPKNQIVEIAGKLIPGLVYVGNPPKFKSGFLKKQRCQAYIDPTLPVKSGLADSSGSKVTSNTSYDTLSAYERDQYLNWLVAGKTFQFFDPRFIYIYFLGLERQLLVGEPTLADVNDILDEFELLTEKFNNLDLQYINKVQHFFQIVTDVAPYYFNAIESDFVLDPLIPKIEGGLKMLNNEPLTYQQYYCYLMEVDNDNLQNIRQRYPLDFERSFKQKFGKALSKRNL